MPLAFSRAVSQHTSSRTDAVWRCAVVVAALAAAAPLRAQSAQNAAPSAEQRSHEVRRGDTLWDLAQTYLADAFLWPEIYRLNTAVVEDPHWIYPGERLRLPGLQPPVAVEQPPSGVPQLVAVAADDALESSVFIKVPQRQGVQPTRLEGMVDGTPRRALREGEIEAAPWVGRRGGLGQRGRVVASAELPGIVEASRRTRLQPQERVHVTLPRTMAPTRGDRYLVVATGEELPGGSQVFVPTGIIEVERVTDGAATTARIVRLFDEVKVGQSVIPMERVSTPRDAAPAPVRDGVRAEVIGLPSGAVLPSLQHYVLLNASSGDRVRVGDHFELYRPRVRTDDGVVLPDETIALVQIVRVTERGATGLIVDQVQPAIKPGTQARQTARMP